VKESTLLSIRPHRTLLTVAVAVVLILFSASAANASIPIGQSMTGIATYYDNSGYGACGSYIDAATQDLVAVSYRWWTTANPNNDPICQGISVQVAYHGTTITVPVKDKCPSCDATHIDLSKTAFQRFASTDVGVLNGITWKFVSSGGSALTGATGQSPG
jgi:expansin (peptidoglycan-binding protein)